MAHRSCEVTERYWFRDVEGYDYVCSMKTTLFITISLSALFASCGSESSNTSTDSTASVPDSVPQKVRAGKDATWAYKPDTMVNTILLGDVASLKEYMYSNGAKGEMAGNRSAMYYFNGAESEFLTVFAVNVGSKSIPYGLRIEKNSDTLRNYKLEHNYSTATNFITSSGIYIGMSVDFVRNVYKSQEMLMWTKGDTTYLEYTPVAKDQGHYKRYLHTQYRAKYKFVDDRCRVIEMMVDPEAFAK